MNQERQKLTEFLKHLPHRLSEGASVPLYYQLIRLSERFIVEQKLRAGDRFPSENTIAESFGVSRPTAHRAIKELVARGWLVRERGRGTFVAHGSHAELTLREDELSLPDRYLGEGELSCRILDVSEGPASQEVADALCLSVGERVCRLRRLRCIDGRPIILDDSYLAVDRFPGLASRASITKSLAATLEESYSTAIASCIRWLKASDALCPDVADQLQIPIMAPVLIVTAVASTEAQTPVVYVREYIRESVSVLSDARPRQRCATATGLGGARDARR